MGARGRAAPPNSRLFLDGRNWLSELLKEFDLSLLVLRAERPEPADDLSGFAAFRPGYLGVVGRTDDVLRRWAIRDVALRSGRRHWTASSRNPRRVFVIRRRQIMQFDRSADGVVQGAHHKWSIRDPAVGCNCARGRAVHGKPIQINAGVMQEWSAHPSHAHKRRSAEIPAIGSALLAGKIVISEIASYIEGCEGPACGTTTSFIFELRLITFSFFIHKRQPIDDQREAGCGRKTLRVDGRHRVDEQVREKRRPNKAEVLSANVGWRLPRPLNRRMATGATQLAIVLVNGVAIETIIARRWHAARNHPVGKGHQVNSE